MTTNAQDAPASPLSARGLAITSLAIGAGLLFATSIVKIAAAAPPASEPFAIALGVGGVLSIVLIVAAIVTGHVAFSLAKQGTGRAASAAALAVGYTLLLLWVVRLIAVLVAVANRRLWFDDVLMGFFLYI